MPKFTKLYTDNVKIINLNYEISIPISKEFNLNPFRKCLSAFFNIFDIKDIYKEYELRYKRVSNYSKTDGEHLFRFNKTGSYQKKSLID